MYNNFELLKARHINNISKGFNIGNLYGFGVVDNLNDLEIFISTRISFINLKCGFIFIL